MTVGQPLDLASVGPGQAVAAIPVTGQGEIGHLQVMAQLYRRDYRPCSNACAGSSSRAAAATNPVRSAQCLDNANRLSSVINGHIIVISGFLGGLGFRRSQSTHVPVNPARYPPAPALPGARLVTLIVINRPHVTVRRDYCLVSCFSASLALARSACSSVRRV
jgi:hypothetical protein